jgi:hypothetical protein
MGRPVTVVVGPLASATANKISLTQKAAISGTNYIVLNGAAGSFSANSICQSQTPGGAGALTLNGSLVSGGVAYLGQNQRIYITGGSNESAKTFAVVGTKLTPLGLTSVTETITGPNASTVSSINQYYTIISITASAGTTGAITVGQYGTATLDVARQVLFTPAGADSGITYTISGTDVSGTAISETVTGVNNPSTAVTTLSYLTITSLSTSGAVASTMTVGTNGVAHSPWVMFDAYSASAPISIQCTASGTVNYTVQQTLDNPTSLGNTTIYGRPDLVTWVNHPDTNLVSATGTVQGNYAYEPAFARVLLNSGTGTVTATFIQAGNW